MAELGFGSGVLAQSLDEQGGGCDAVARTPCLMPEGHASTYQLLHLGAICTASWSFVCEVLSSSWGSWEGHNK